VDLHPGNRVSDNKPPPFRIDCRDFGEKSQNAFEPWRRQKEVYYGDKGSCPPSRRRP
jgi:hypothetical protein